MQIVESQPPNPKPIAVPIPVSGRMWITSDLLGQIAAEAWQLGRKDQVIVKIRLSYNDAGEADCVIFDHA